MFNWVPPTSALAFILISIMEEQENSAILRGALKKNQNKILLENLLRSVWE